MLFAIRIPKTTLTKIVLISVTIAAKANRVPVIRFLPHARAGSNANVRHLNSSHVAAIAASMASHKSAVRL